MKVGTRSKFRWLWVAALCGIVACSEKQPDRTETTGQDFLSAHWSRPLEPQGAPPPEWSERERSLAPADCGSCHPDQFADWSTTVHSRAMSPGLLGQLVDLSAEDRASQYTCLSCHAPSAEQANGVQEFIRATQRGDALAWSDRSEAPLFVHGLACFNCHYRRFTVYGPERKPELEPIPDDIRRQLPHGGWEIRSEFEDSRFCAACHQFEAGERAVNGKLLENTYEEWRLSSFAVEGEGGKTCQQCHMPDRRHLWRGIHDSAIVRDGVEIVASVGSLTGETVSAALTLTSVQVGHNFPTYATPKVYLEAYQIGADSSILEGTLARDTIGWHLSQNLTQEYFDTRLAPGDSAVLEYQRPRGGDAVALIFEVWVAPDAFYTQFYEAKLAGDFTEYGTAMIERALRESRESVYTIFEERIELPAVQ